MDPRHLQNAPIREAIFDIRIKRLKDEFAQRFAEPSKEFREQYPVRLEMNETTNAAKIEIETGRMSEQSAKMRHVGYFFRREDQKEIVQFRTDGYTFNRLEPYTSWDDFSRKAKNGLKEYESLAGSIVISRAALRYINRIRLPRERFDTDDYFTCPPKVPETVAQTVTNFFSRVQILDEGTGLEAILIQTLDFLADGDSLEWILDIDSYKVLEVSPDNPRLFESFDNLRKFKNDIFFGSLKESILEVTEWQ